LTPFPADALPEVSEAEAKRRGREFIAKLPDSEKKQRMLAVFDAYMDGKKTGEVMAAAGVSKGSVSGYFQPGREDFRQTLQSAIPKLLTNGHETPKEEMRELIAAVRPVALRERLLKVWARL
jgi:DNA-directed RNA polymerase specialized sigma24 family protein